MPVDRLLGRPTSRRGRLVLLANLRSRLVRRVSNHFDLDARSDTLVRSALGQQGLDPGHLILLLVPIRNRSLEHLRRIAAVERPLQVLLRELAAVPHTDPALASDFQVGALAHLLVVELVPVVLVGVVTAVNGDAVIATAPALVHIAARQALAERLLLRVGALGRRESLSLRLQLRRGQMLGLLFDAHEVALGGLWLFVPAGRGASPGRCAAG